MSRAADFRAEVKPRAQEPITISHDAMSHGRQLFRIIQLQRERDSKHAQVLSLASICVLPERKST